MARDRDRERVEDVAGMDLYFKSTSKYSNESVRVLSLVIVFFIGTPYLVPLHMHAV